MTEEASYPLPETDMSDGDLLESHAPVPDLQCIFPSLSHCLRMKFRSLLPTAAASPGGSLVQ